MPHNPDVNQEAAELESTPVERNVESVRRGIGSRIESVFIWADDAIDNVAMNIGDAVVEGVKASFTRVQNWKNMSDTSQENKK